MRYHSNAKTNIKQREFIKQSNLSTRQLAKILHVSHVTVAKWKKVDHTKDKSSAPGEVHYAVDKKYWVIIKRVREKAKLPLDDLLYQLKNYIPNLNRSNLYRILLKYRLNKLTKEEKREIKKFKEYKPGYLHIDTFYLPKINGERMYCFLAIDRATRLIFLRIYKDKSQESASEFLKQAIEFYPFKIHTILTDNGREYTLLGQKVFGKSSNKSSLFELVCEMFDIEHRKTKPKHPWTNGMAERAVREVKEHTSKIKRYSSQEEMIKDVLNYQNTHNFNYRMKVLNYKTPYEKVLEWYNKNPEIFTRHPRSLKKFRC